MIHSETAEAAPNPRYCRVPVGRPSDPLVTGSRPLPLSKKKYWNAPQRTAIQHTHTPRAWTNTYSPSKLLLMLGGEDYPGLLAAPKRHQPTFQGIPQPTEPNPAGATRRLLLATPGPLRSLLRGAGTGHISSAHTQQPGYPFSLSPGGGELRAWWPGFQKRPCSYPV